MGLSKPFAGGPVVSISISVDDIEVTQAIQNMQHDVPLVAGKQTVVRAYVTLTSNVAATVRGELAVRRGASGSARIVPSIGTVALVPNSNATLRAKREQVDASLNFLLPVDLLTAGNLSVTLSRVVDADTGEDAGIAGALPERKVVLEESPRLCLRLVRIRHHTQQDPGRQYMPSPTDVALVKSWLCRAYPIAELSFSEVIVDAPREFPFECGTINAQLSALRNVDLSTGTDPLTHYFGLVADGAGFMRGCAHVPSVPDPSAVGSGPTGPSGFAWDTDGSYGDWYTGHELGHTFGREHPGFCGGNTRDDTSYPFPNGQLSGAAGEFVGFDVGDAALGLPMAGLSGAKWHDVMTYCEFQWLSSYTYVAIRRQLIAEASIHGVPVAPGANLMSLAPSKVSVFSTSSDVWINVVAEINLTSRTGAILYVHPDAVKSRAGSPANNQVHIRLVAADGAILLEEPAVIKLDACREPSDPERGTIDTVVRRLANIHTVELRYFDQLLDSYAVGPVQPPLVSNIRPVSAGFSGPVPGAPVAPPFPSDSVVFSWIPVPLIDSFAEELPDSGAPPSNLRYSVQLSKDDGHSWQTIAVGQRRPEVSVSREMLPGGGTVKLRVIATNGVDSMATISESFDADAL